MKFDLRITSYTQYSFIQHKGAFTGDVYSHIAQMLHARQQHHPLENIIFDLSETTFPEGKAGAVRMAMKTIFNGAQRIKSNVVLICCHNTTNINELAAIYQNITEEFQTNLRVVSNLAQAEEWLALQTGSLVGHDNKTFDYRFCEKNYFTEVTLTGAMSTAEFVAIRELLDYRHKLTQNGNVLIDLMQVEFTGNSHDVMKLAMKQSLRCPSGPAAFSALVCPSKEVERLAKMYLTIAEDDSDKFSLFQSRIKAKEWMTHHILDAIDTTEKSCAL